MKTVSHMNTARFCLLSIVVWLGNRGAADSASSQDRAPADIYGAPVIRHITSGPGSTSNSGLVGALAEHGDGTLQWFFVDGITGGIPSPAPLPPGARISDVADDVGSETSPFGRGAVALDRSLAVYHSRIRKEPDGSSSVDAPVRHGPFGVPETDGHGTTVAYAPNLSDPSDPWLALGTDSGKVIFIRRGQRVEDVRLSGSIAGLAVVPHAGSPAFVALLNAAEGQRLVGIRPPDRSAPIRVVFDLTPAAAPGSAAMGIRIEDVFSGLDDASSGPWDNFGPVHLIAADASRFLHRLTIPEDSTIGGTFRIRALEAANVPIAAAAVGRGSLAMLPVDGAGVLYDAGFRVDRGGVSGKLFTILGSSVELHPRTLGVAGRVPVTAAIEAADQGASRIDPATVELHIGAGVVRVAPDVMPRLGDADHDGNADLWVGFDRGAVQALVSSSTRPVIATVRWQFVDGSRGFASAELRFTSEDDDAEGGQAESSRF